jgi:hypothetical protein
MYLHDALSNDVYARVVEKLNGSRPFAELPAGEQLETLKGSRARTSRLQRPALRRFGSSTRGRC